MAVGCVLPPAGVGWGVVSEGGIKTASIVWRYPLDAPTSRGGHDFRRIIDSWGVQGRDLDLGAVHRRGLEVEREVRRRDFRAEHVVGEDRDELVFVLGLEQILDRAVRKRGERGVRRREQRERAGAIERVLEIGRVDGRE